MLVSIGSWYAVNCSQVEIFVILGTGIYVRNDWRMNMKGCKR
jgi:hypothetical protein